MIALFVALVVLIILHNRYEEKEQREHKQEDYDSIQKYLLDEKSLAASKKPILWIHVPHEYNSRKWSSFGSRSSFELNQPYLHLCAKSIIDKCDSSFTICIVDDASFKKLIPGWSIDLSKIGAPIINNMRQLALMNLLSLYGGLICPLSFLCFKDLIGLYKRGTRNGKIFVCETTNKNNTNYQFYPSITFCGAPRSAADTVRKTIDFIQRTSSNDYTADLEFHGKFDRWINKQIDNGLVDLIDGIEIGVKRVDETPIRLDDLMSNNYLNLYEDGYGILIPADELLKRTKYEWFTVDKHVEHSNTILGNYFLLTMKTCSEGMSFVTI
jgi:hypothetical protein